jgi:hypothetical protein
MNEQTIIRDERTKSIGNEGDHLGFTILLFGVLVDVFFRSALFNQSPWDLFALVVISSWASLIYQGLHKTLPAHFWRSILILAVATALLSAALVVVILKFRKIL